MSLSDGPLDVYPPACLNTLYKDYKSHPCIDCCPRNAIELRPLNINKDLCDGCGICASVCPTDALSLKARSFRRLLDDASLKRDKKPIIHCSKVKGGGMEVLCLGILEEGLLVELMQRRGGDIELISGECGSCEKSPGGHIALQNMNKANSIMTLSGCRESVGIVATAKMKENAEKGYTRRDLFTSLGSKVSGFISNVVEEEDLKKWRRGMTTIKRERLLSLIECLGGLTAFVPLEGALPFHGKEINSSCDSCDGLWRCAIFCPTGALSLSGEADRNEAAIYFEPGRCVDCKMCEMVCDREAIKGISLAAEELAHLSLRYALVSFAVGRCVECGSRTRRADEDLCMDCSQRQSKMSWHTG